MNHEQSESETSSIGSCSSPNGSMEMPSYYVQIPSSTESFCSPPHSSSTSYVGYTGGDGGSSDGSSCSELSSDYSSSYQSLMIGRLMRRRDEEWMACNMKEEDELVQGSRKNKCSSIHYLFPVVVGLMFLFIIFCLILWGVSKPIKTHILVKDLKLHSFYMGFGSDHTGVPTSLLSLDTSLKLSIYNPATFFGIHVSAQSRLLYSGLQIATSNLRYYQPRKSSNLLCINIGGNKVPLYGAGGILAIADRDGRIPLRLEIQIQALGKVFGRLVKTHQRWNVSCSLTIKNDNNRRSIKFKQNSCIYL
ncbi:uncharacterized protein LOC124935154 [Impatiens glandulifera]|uniref:uncharacterized protein LOC124935154 n=1 Tax=Impatiens glandulifera TaxID=253017 RepID=UPI001FB13BF3|nr:uncharacterized protein LOC124935154 [Impatiens glandulifera]